MGGAVIASKDLVASMKRDFVIIGATLDPHAAFLIQRGLKTYFLRYERQCSNAAAIAEFLLAHPAVGSVSYPGLPSHPRHGLARKQMCDFGTIVTIDLKGNAITAKRFSESLNLFAISASLGSTESLVQPGRLMRPADLSEQEREWAAVTDQTIRLSIGIEDLEDLKSDLAHALDVAKS
jgi:cystathionine beta-lyase/cystathionine gamma-synthase